MKHTGIKIVIIINYNVVIWDIVIEPKIKSFIEGCVVSFDDYVKS